jgi:predicted MFS family arabinose efflux permease
MDSEAHQSLKPGTILLMAVGCGIDVADNYYHQPLLPQMAHGVHASEAWAGYLPALNQAGFALGLLLFVPLGDRLERRRLDLLGGQGVQIAELTVDLHQAGLNAPGYVRSPLRGFSYTL